jgi:hypothetical protein
MMILDLWEVTIEFMKPRPRNCCGFYLSCLTSPWQPSQPSPQSPAQGPQLTEEQGLEDDFGRFCHFWGS